MKLRHLQVFLGVQRAGSINAAARQMRVSQPAVSKMLAELEAELEVPLLTRTSRGATPTAFGHALVKHAQLIDQQLRYAREEIGAIRGRMEGQLTIGVTALTSLGPCAEAVKSFGNAYPKVRMTVVELRPYQIRNAIADGSIDIGLVSDIHDPDTPLKQKPIFNAPRVIVAHVSYARGKRYALDDLRDQSWVNLDPPDDGQDQVSNLFRLHHVTPPENVIHCTSTNMFIDLIHSGHHLGIVSAMGLGNPAFTGMVRPLELVEPVPPIGVFLLTNPNTTGETALKFLGYLQIAVRRRFDQPPAV